MGIKNRADNRNRKEKKVAICNIRQFDAMYSFQDDDERDVFGDAGLDYNELEFMDPKERREILKAVGLNPKEFDF